MTTGWARTKEIFSLALECEPAGRSACLAEACGGDEALRALDVILDGPVACGWLKAKLGVLKGGGDDITLDIRTLRKDFMSMVATGALGGVPMPMSPAEFGKLVSDETEKWAKVVKFANISVD